MGTQLSVRLSPLREVDERDTNLYFLANVNVLCEHALRNCDELDMVGISIRNEVNLTDKAIWINFRLKDQLSTEVILNVWQNVKKSNSSFNVLAKLLFQVHSLNMPVGFRSLKTRGRPLDTLANFEKSIVKLKAETNCLAHALVIEIANIKEDPKYKSYRERRKIGSVVQRLL